MIRRRDSISLIVGSALGAAGANARLDSKASSQAAQQGGGDSNMSTQPVGHTLGELFLPPARELD